MTHIQFTRSQTGAAPAPAAHQRLLERAAQLRARNVLLRSGLLLQQGLAARGAARAEHLRLAQDAGIGPLHMRACGQCMPGNSCRACGARPGVRLADASRLSGSSHRGLIAL